MKYFILMAFQTAFFSVHVNAQSADVLDDAYGENSYFWGTEEELSADQKLIKDQFDALDNVYSLAARDLPQKAYTENSIKVMWWNIDCATNVKRISGQRNYGSNLEKNLLDIEASGMRPDILILGEYCPYYLKDNFERQISGKYKYKHHLVRNIPEFKTQSGKTNERNGIMVFSDLPLKVIAEETLYAEESKTNNDKKNRKYLLLQASKGNQKFYLNPLHLYNPWREVRDKYGILGTLMEIEGGRSNPNALQGVQVVEKNLSYVDASERLLSIGDFNSPKRFYAIDGYVYKQFNRVYDSLISDGSDTYVDGGAFMTTAIDHAFGQNITPLYDRVLPLAGSGHLPIYLVFE